MRLDYARWRSMSPAFPVEVEIDFTKIRGRFLALVGRGLAGKSTSSEIMLPGTIYRECPTRGSLRELATARDSFCENRVTIGDQTFTIRHDIDGISGKSESSVTDSAGREVLENRKVSTYDAWAEKTFPPASLLYCSIFGPQDDGGIIDPMLKSADRKTVFLRATGVERIETVAARAREKTKAAKAEHTSADARLRDERARALPLPKATEDADRARAVEDSAGAAARGAAEHAARAETLAQEVAQEELQAREHGAALDAAERTLAAASLRVNALVSSSLELRDTLECADAIRTAAARVRAIDVDLASRAVAGDPAIEPLNRLNRENAAMGATRDHVRRLRADVAEEAKRMAERDRLLAEASALPIAEQVSADAMADVDAAEAGLQALRERGANGAQGRIGHLRGALQDVAESHGPVVASEAAEALTRDDAAAEELQRLPADVRQATETLKAARAELDGARRTLEATRQAKARAEALTPRPGLAESLAAAERAEAEGSDRIVLAQADYASATAQRTASTNQAQVFRSEREALLPLAQRLQELDGAEALSSELIAQRATADREASAAQEKLAALQALPAPVVRSRPDLAGARALLAAAERTHADARTSLALAERSLAEAKASAERVEELERDLSLAAEDLADWTRLAADLGPDGLQALELDAAGPEINALANRFLHECFSNRFTVSVETRPQSEDSAREPCEIRVFDSEEGVWKLARRLSGSGSKIVGAGLRWAFVVIACRQWGIEAPTIFCDEADAMTDDDQAHALFAMMRLAADIIGASRVIYITHNEAVKALADTRLHVENGTITVDDGSPPSALRAA